MGIAINKDKIETRALEVESKISELEKEIHQANLNSRYGFEYDEMKLEVRELESELRSLGY